MLASLLLLVTAAGSGSSGEVEYDHQVDFSKYKTWSWHEGVTRAMSPVIDNRIREAIEKGLAARGLSQADSNATLGVVYHASKTTEIALAPLGTEAPPTGLRYSQKGSLVVEMLDAGSGKVVWRGQAAAVMKYGPNEIAEQIKTAVDKLLEGFPPRP
jgi:hypothetical protein